MKRERKVAVIIAVTALLSTPLLYAEDFVDSCKVCLNDGKSTPEQMQQVCECMKRETKLTKYEDFSRLRTSLNKYRNLDEVSKDFVKNEEDEKVFLATFKCSLSVWTDDNNKALSQEKAKKEESKK